MAAMMDWTRRGFVTAWLAAPALAWFPGRAQGALARVRLETGAPWSELERVWLRLGLGAPERVVARAHPGWWAAGQALPDRWEAWVEAAGGHVLVVECRPREWVREAAPRAGFRGGEAVARALRGS